MRKFSVINNEKSAGLNLTLHESYVLNWLADLPNTSKEHLILTGKSYYHVDTIKAEEDLPLVKLTRQSMYRYLRKLEHLGLLKQIRMKNKNYVWLSPDAKTWNHGEDAA